MSTCRACSAPVVWALTEAGKPMPLDGDGNGRLAAAPDGNVAVTPSTDGLRARILSANDAPEAGEVRAMPHFATCPSWGLS